MFWGAWNLKATCGENMRRNFLKKVPESGAMAGVKGVGNRAGLRSVPRPVNTLQRSEVGVFLLVGKSGNGHLSTVVQSSSSGAHLPQKESCGTARPSRMTTIGEVRRLGRHPQGAGHSAGRPRAQRR